MEPKIYTRNTMHRRVAGKTPEGKEAGEADEMDQAELADSDPNQERWRHDNGEGYEDGERHPGKYVPICRILDISTFPPPCPGEMKRNGSTAHAGKSEGRNRVIGGSHAGSWAQG
ncbi:uncharacterized protein AAG666_023222 isoform 5-T25 [Megaptera novaeangliae]